MCARGEEQTKGFGNGGKGKEMTNVPDRKWKRGNEIKDKVKEVVQANPHCSARSVCICDAR